MKIKIRTFLKEKSKYEDMEFVKDSEVVDLQLNLINKTKEIEVKDKIKLTLHNL